jgi:hypothetical protein
MSLLKHKDRTLLRLRGERGYSDVYTRLAHCTYWDPVACFKPSLSFKYNIVLVLKKNL